MQPFTVGDWIQIKDMKYLITKMNLMTTVMEDCWGFTSYWSNTLLLQNLDGMLNVSQTKFPTHQLSFYLNQDITNSELNIIKQRFQLYTNNEMSADVGDSWFVNVYTFLFLKNIMYLIYNTIYNDRFVITEMDSISRIKVAIWIVGFVPFSDFIKYKI